ncbi:MAG TPA: cysteate synthase [Candidatus Methanoperedenaceae archaeon]|nr:cysteate synthase [Candidatus Methanoperedenaceae archaeon]
MCYEDKYRLVCAGCGRSFDGCTLTCRHDDALLRSDYFNTRISPRNLPGIGRFHDWLPVLEPITADSGPVTYKSAGLAAELGLANLHISFNGYCPEKGAFVKTCSFKEFEAFPTMLRVKEAGEKALVLASAGNTARAFAHVSTLTGIDVYIVVPRKGLNRMWLPEEPTATIHLIEMNSNCDYADTIQFAEKLAKLPGLMPEGGARNIARRDGMGTVMLDAAFKLRRLPDVYFQAIGSGTGGIAVWEAALRLIRDGRFGNRLPALHLAQNLPFAPMFNAWNAGRRSIVEELDMPQPKKLIASMYSDILSNRKPPYGIGGGVYDALAGTSGRMYGVTNNEAISARRLFERLEGIDIVPPAAVAVAALVKAVESGTVEHDDCILLNITGGGVERLKKDYKLIEIKPAASAGADTPVEQVLYETG